MAEQKPISRQIDDIIFDSGRKYAQMFEDDNLKFTEALLFLGGSRRLMKWVYGMLVSRNLITKMEDLPQDQKQSMWEFVKEICVGEHRTQQKMHEMAIVFYVIEYFLNEQKPSE